MRLREVNIWMRLLRAEGNCRKGACKILKIMMVEKATAASIVLPS
jgi:hypothetical protein